MKYAVENVQATGDVIVADEVVHPGFVVGLIAASACGKSWIASQLTEAGIVAPTPTKTDRPPRLGETDTPYDHTFVDTPTFDKHIREGRFAIYATLYGHRYSLPPIATPANPQQPSLVLLKDAVVAPFRGLYPCSKIYHVESLDGREKLEDRMYLRGQSPGDIADRVAKYTTENELGRELADRVFVSPGHPQAVLYDIWAALEQDLAEHDRVCVSELVSQY